MRKIFLVFRYQHEIMNYSERIVKCCLHKLDNSQRFKLQQQHVFSELHVIAYTRKIARTCLAKYIYEIASAKQERIAL
jgi:hypothetical protein